MGTDTDWVSVVVSIEHTIALKTDGSLWAWGLNGAGQLGDGTTENRSSPVQIGTDTDWVSIHAADNHTMAIKTDGTLWGWGHNLHVRIGEEIVSDYIDGTNILKPTQINAYEFWIRATTPIPLWRRWTYLFIKEDGSLWGWGNNHFGQIGDGTTIDRDTPVQIGMDTDWEKVAFGGGRVIAVKTDGSVWSWGWGGFPEGGPWTCDLGFCTNVSMIGDGTHCEDRHSPVMILEGFGSS